MLISDTICTSEEFSLRFGIPVVAMYKENGTLFLPDEAKINYGSWFTGVKDSTKKIRLISLDADVNAIEFPIDCHKLEYYKLTEDDYCLLRETGNNVLAIKWGTVNGNMIEHVMEQMRAHDIKITHAIICGAKEKFLKSYYKNRL